MVYIKLGDTQVSIDENQWSDSEGLLVPWHFPCIFWKECDVGHCDLTDGRRSVMLVHCSMPEFVSKTSNVDEKQKSPNFTVAVDLQSELTQEELAEEITSVLQNAIAEVQAKKSLLVEHSDDMSKGEFGSIINNLHIDFEMLRNLQQFTIRNHAN